MNEYDPSASPGIPPERREAMLGELMGVMQQTHQARRVRRRMLIGAQVAAAVVATWWVSPYFGHWAGPPVSYVDAPSGQEESGGTSGDLTHATHVLKFVSVTTSMEKYVVAPTVRIERVDDYALVETLRAWGRPAGLIRMDDRVALVPAIADVDPDTER